MSKVDCSCSTPSAPGGDEGHRACAQGEGDWGGTQGARGADTTRPAPAPASGVEAAIIMFASAPLLVLLASRPRATGAS
eukprot:scaffold14398_cov83-Phaeocystis_antarctica.AAC.4